LTIPASASPSDVVSYLPSTDGSHDPWVPPISVPQAYIGGSNNIVVNARSPDMTPYSGVRVSATDTSGATSNLGTTDSSGSVRATLAGWGNSGVLFIKGVGTNIGTSFTTLRRSTSDKVEEWRQSASDSWEEFKEPFSVQYWVDLMLEPIMGTN